jgi:cytochrome c-type biogenesis protein CcmH
MNFWIISISLLAIAAAIISWPLFAGSAKERVIGVSLLLIMPLAGLFMYQNIGTPEAINIPTVKPQQAAQTQDPHSGNQPDMDVMVAQLQQRMNENPDDPEGWLILGRSLKTMERYAEAATALANANRLAPGTPLIMIELAEASLFASGQPQISPQAQQLIEEAIAIDPQQQKGLWLLGMAAAQKGDEARAIAMWQRLLGLLDPASGAAQTVNQQIEMAQAKLGEAAPAVAAAEVAEMGDATPAIAAAEVAVVEDAAAKVAVAEFGIPVTITISEELAGVVPGNAALFVFIHPTGAVGMPLAVKRVAPRGFPMSLHFTDADLLRPGMSLKDFEQLDISARISIAGIANAAPGDIQANLVTLDTNAVAKIALTLDQRVP